MSERQDFLPKKDQEKEIQSEIQIRPASHDPKGCPNIAPSRHLSHLQELPGAGDDGDEDDDSDSRKNQKKVIQSGISTRPTSQDPEGCPDVPPPSSHHLSELRGFREVRGEEDEKEQRQLGKSEVAEDDDGFRTPESLEHRIPVITACPPAPKKSCRPKISQGKRSRTTGELLDLSDEPHICSFSFLPPPGPLLHQAAMPLCCSEDGVFVLFGWSSGTPAFTGAFGVYVVHRRGLRFSVCAFLSYVLIIVHGGDIPCISAALGL
nr:cyclin-dependent protein kinase inhibitor SMR3-like [Ipomoea batatas]